jgi:hypothetical protein
MKLTTIALASAFARGLLVRFSTVVAQRGLGGGQMHVQRKNRRGDLIPVLVAAIVAVVGQTVILFNDLGPGNNSQGSGSARMTTAAAVSRAGAIEISSEPPAGRPISTRLTSTLPRETTRGQEK